MKIYMIRHGQASFGSPNYDRLSEKGIEQVRALAGYLYSAGVDFDAVYSGTMERQKQSAAEFIRHNVHAVESKSAVKEIEGFNEHNTEQIFRSILPELRERDPELIFDLDNLMSDRKLFQSVYKKVMTAWIRGSCSNLHCETYDQFRTRVRSALHYVAAECKDGGNAAVFTSAGPVSSAVSSIIGVKGEEALRLESETANCSITILAGRGDRLRLISFNSFTHMISRDKENLLTYR